MSWFRTRPSDLPRVLRFRMFECRPCDTIVVTAEFVYRTVKASESKRYIAWAG